MDPVVIIGAGPAGAAAALELARKGADVVIIEAADDLGGLSRTYEFNGARFDVGPHRFFSRNEEVRALWAETLGDEFADVDRLTRIFYRGKLLNYPISIGDTLAKVGAVQTAGFALSYLGARVRSALVRRPPASFEDWVVAHFGRRLFEAFFKTYTEKVWGIPCGEIGAEWAAQRIKGLSLGEAVRNAVFKPRERARTLVERFKYPRLGAGQMYRRMVERAREHGARVLPGTRAVGIRHEGGRAVAVLTDAAGEVPCAAVLTSNPITEVALGLDPAPPPAVRDAARALRFRCHLSVHLLVEGDVFPDNWIYVHSTEVTLGRVANYATFSPAMRDPAGRTPVTVEYFQFPDDPLYRNPDDKALIAYARAELDRMGIVQPEQIADGFVIRSPHAYPVLDRGYGPHLETVRGHLAGLSNLQPIGRGGMFKYNNQDHSIFTGLLAARNILGAEHDVWSVNTDAEYHEGGKAQ